MKIIYTATVFDKYDKKKKIATYRQRSFDEPVPKFIPDGERGYGDREPSPVLTHTHRNRTDNCDCFGNIPTCTKCGGTGMREDIID